MLDIYVSDGRISDGSSACIFYQCNRKAITAEDGKEAWIEIIRIRERDDQGKKLP